MAPMLSCHAMPFDLPLVITTSTKTSFASCAATHYTYILNPLPTTAIANFGPPHLTITPHTRAPLFKLASWGWITGAREAF